MLLGGAVWRVTEVLPAQVCVLCVLGTRPRWQEEAATEGSRWHCPRSKAGTEARWWRIPSWPPVARDGLAAGAKLAALFQRFWRLTRSSTRDKRENKWELA